MSYCPKDQAVTNIFCEVCSQTRCLTRRNAWKRGFVRSHM